MGEMLWSSVFNQTHFIANNLVKPMQSRNRFNTEAQSTWTRPPLGWVKLNVDGAFAQRGNTGCRGLVRNLEGMFEKGFFGKVSPSNALWAELWSILFGLKLARSLSTPRVIVEADSKVVVEALLYELSTNPSI